MASRAIQVVGMFAYPLWEKNRRRYCAGFIGLVAIFVAVHFVSRFFGGLLAMAYGGILAGFVMTVVGPLVWGGPQTIQQTSTFTNGVLGLPVTDSELVWFPIGFAFLGFAAPWLAFVAAALRPLHIPLALPFLHAPIYPFGLPLLCVGAMVSSSVWSRWTISTGKLSGCLVALVSMLSYFVPFELLFGVPEVFLDALCFVICVASVYGSFKACPRARHGMSGSESPVLVAKSGRVERKESSKSKPAFPSVWSTQVWFDEGPARISIWFLPLTILLFVGMFRLIPSVNGLMDHGHHLAGGFESSPSLWGIHLARESQLYVMFLQFLPIGLIAAAESPAFGMFKADPSLLKTPGLDRFTAIRPIASVQVTGARLYVVAKTACLCAPGILCLGWYFLMQPAKEGDRIGTLMSLISNHLGPYPGVSWIIGVLFLPLVIWSLLSGNPLRYFLRSRVLQILGFSLILAPSFVNIGLLLLLRSEFSLDTFSDALPTVLGAMLALKGFVAVRGWATVRRENLIPAKTLQVGAFIWVATLMIVGGAFSYALGAVFPLWAILAVVAIVLPVNRILWQVVGLERSRHGQLKNSKS